MSPDLLREAREYRRVMEQTNLASDEVARVRARIHRRLGKRSSRVWLRVMIPAGATAAAALMWWLALRPGLTWSVSNDANGCASLRADTCLSTFGCLAPVTVRRGDDVVEVAPGTELLLRGDRETQMRQGRARFNVTPRRDHRFRVRVAVGFIEVVGTEFDVWQDERSGGVDVHQGQVILNLDHGGSEHLASGESRHWTNEPGPASVFMPNSGKAARGSATSKPRRQGEKATAPKTATKQRVENLLRHQFQLRAQRRHDEALRELRAACQDTSFSRRQKIRLSLEIGRVLEQQGDVAAACRHWRRHSRLFGKGSLDADAVRFLVNCE